MFAGGDELGTIDARFLQGLDGEHRPPSFTLGGRAWQLVSVHWGRGVCHVQPAEHGGHTRWSGSPRPLSAAICHAIRDVLRTDAEPSTWSSRARKVLGEQRGLHAFLRDDPSPMLREGAELCWWNFAGGRMNLLLARMLEKEFGGKVVARDLSLTLKQEAAASEIVVRDTLSRWTAEHRPTAADALEYAGMATHSRLSKFEAYRRASKASNARIAPRRRSSGSTFQSGARAAGPASQTILSIMATSPSPPFARFPRMIPTGRRPLATSAR